MEGVLRSSSGWRGAAGAAEDEEESAVMEVVSDDDMLVGERDGEVGCVRDKAR